MLARLRLRLIPSALALWATALSCPNALAAKDDLIHVSRPFAGPPTRSNGASALPHLSHDGRYVVFASEASNLVPGDSNGSRDVFRFDTVTGQMVLVSRADGPAGLPGNDDSGGDLIGGESRHAVSADGRFVAFISSADNLLADDNDAVQNVYVRDVLLGRTLLASRTDADQAAVGGDSGEGLDISGSGRYVAFNTEATNMPSAGPGAADRQIVVRDLVAGTTTLVSRTPGGAAGDDDSGTPTISADGRRVAFNTSAVNLGADASDPMEVDDRVVVRDLAANTLVIASRLDGPAGAPQVSFGGNISGDGRAVGWSTGNGDEYFVRYLDLGRTIEATVAPGGGPIPGFCCYEYDLSFDARYVAIYGGGLDPSTPWEVYHRDTVLGRTLLVSRRSGPAGAREPSEHGWGVGISGDGRFVAFGSDSRNLSDLDFEGMPGFDSDVFRRDVLGPPPQPPPGGRVINGTPGNDRLIGTPFNDVINCGAGDDVVDAGGGDDVINCGPGNDAIDAGAGNDLVNGDSGNDRILGGAGSDRLFGGSGRDAIAGGSERDRIDGGGGSDTAAGDGGNDVISGRAGDDRLSGNAGNDRLSGDAGNDRASGGSGNDRASGGSGRDVASGGSGRDRLAGGSGNDRLRGGAGNDRMSGGAGNDRLLGGRGRDVLRGGAGRDRLVGGPGLDRLLGGPGRDRSRQ